jgi:hypothetical protein
MNRNSLLIESLRKARVRPEHSIWEMAMAVIGAAFGATTPRRREPSR